MVQALGSHDQVGSSTSVAELRKRVLNIKSDGVIGLHKRIKLSLCADTQGDDYITGEQPGPIGLKLSKTPSFLNLVNIIRSKVRAKNSLNDTNHALTQTLAQENTNHCISQSQQTSEKLKASNFPALRLEIGTYKRTSVYEGVLTAKCYYAKRKLVWEVLNGPMKSKMEIQWSDIEAIKATMNDNEAGILEVELNQPPMFSKEMDPQPRKHTLWQTASDFTDGQALICRRHRVEFPPGTLDKHYEKLLQCDHRLFELSQKPFPSGKCPYFHPNVYNCNYIPSRLTSCQSQLLPSPHSYQNLNLATSSPLQVMNSWQGDKEEGNWVVQQGKHAHNICFPDDKTQSLQLPDAEELFEEKSQNGSQFIGGNNEALLTRVRSMCLLVDPSENNNMGMQQLDYIRDNFGNDGSLTRGSELFDVDRGMIWPLPIRTLSPHVSSEGLVTVNGKPYAFLDPMVGDYSDVNAICYDHQWK